MKMKKKTKIIAAHAAVLAALLAVALFWMRDASHILHRKAYDPEGPTETKLDSLSKWVPGDADFFVALDVPRAMANQPLGEAVESAISGKSGVGVDLLSSLMADQSALGLIAVTGRLGGLGEGSDAVMIAQGNFDEETIVPAIRSAMIAGRSGISAQDLGWSTVYAESDSRDPFAFMVLDKNHIAAGRRDSLVAFYESGPQKGKRAGRLSDDVLTGYFMIGEGMRGSAPKEIFLPEAAYLSSPDGIDLAITIPCEDTAKAQGVLMFLQGLRSLVSIQEATAGHGGLAAVARAFEISAADGDVIIKGKLIPLIVLWAGQEGAAEPEVTPAGPGRSQNPPAPTDR
ncbi:MAG: hypothetical protein JXA24_01105 [Proteobacteria bacterium]|nr:hypothetical protein [Pseudomonadota bacterium]